MHMIHNLNQGNTFLDHSRGTTQSLTQLHVKYHERALLITHQTSNNKVFVLST